MTPAPALLGEAEVVRLFLRDQAGRLTLFRPRASSHPTNGWDALTGQPVEVYEMSSDPYSLLAPPAPPAPPAVTALAPLPEARQ